MPHKYTNPDAVSKPGNYTHVVEATGSRIVFISGQVPLDRDGKVVGSGDLASQAEQAFQNLQACLASAGATFADVTKMTTFIVGYQAFRDRPLLTTVRQKYLPAESARQYPSRRPVPRHARDHDRDRGDRGPALGTAMTLEIVEEPATSENLEAHGSISIAFRVDSRLRVDLVEQGLRGISLSLEPVNSPYMKDYDADEDGRPSRWVERWDISRWGILAAYEGERRTGGAVLAFDTADVWFLDGRKDVAALWDIRVAPEHRRAGIGRALFDAAVEWARKRDCRLLRSRPRT